MISIFEGIVYSTLMTAAELAVYSFTKAPILSLPYSWLMAIFPVNFITVFGGSVLFDIFHVIKNIFNWTTGRSQPRTELVSNSETMLLILEELKEIKDELRESKEKINEMATRLLESNVISPINTRNSVENKKNVAIEEPEPVKIKRRGNNLGF